MKKMFPLYLVLFLCLLTMGCSFTEKNKKVNVYKTESFSESKENSIITFTDSKVVGNFMRAFKNAKKQPGIVNMAAPDYKVKLGSASYFLWISEEQGTMINVDDTNTIFTISKNETKIIYELLHHHEN